MRYIVVLLVFSSLFSFAPQCRAQDGEWDDDSYQDVRSHELSDDQYREQLRNERYETAIARERAERAYLEHQAQSYEYQRRAQEMSLRRAEQEREYNSRSNDISTINQAANSMANMARQAQYFGRGGGW